MFSDIPLLSAISDIVPEVHLFSSEEPPEPDEPPAEVAPTPTLAAVQAQQARNDDLTQRIRGVEAEIEQVEQMRSASEALNSIHRAELTVYSIHSRKSPALRSRIQAERASTAVVVANARKQALKQQIESVKGMAYRLVIHWSSLIVHL